jgi:pyruvate/2-oxoglutarate/acetoin dehydrogenase E1 component
MKSRGFGRCLVDTPLSESIVIGAAVGAALKGMVCVAEIQFNAFAAHGFSQIVNNAASIYWRYGADVPLVIRIPVGAGLAGGPYHALTNENWFCGTPGLKILYPSTPHDAYHGLLEAIEDPGPVIFFEHLTLYPPIGRTTAFGFPVRQTVDSSAHDLVLGHANLKREGRDLSIVTYGAMVHFALHAARQLEELGVDVEVLDVRSLWPLDSDALVRTVQKTGRVIVLQEAQHRSGFAHYMSSKIIERAFMALDAPPVVLGAMDTLPPFAPHLEKAYLPSIEGIVQAAQDLMVEAQRNQG